MRLIRLESDAVVTKSEFTNNMAIPLEVSANAKVALKTLTMQFDAPPIVIDDTNDQLTIKTDSPDSTLLTITIDRGNYNTIEELTEQIQFKLNAAMQSTDTTGIDKSSVGLEWIVSSQRDASNNYLITISFDRQDPVQILGTAQDSILTGMELSGQMFIKNIPDNGQYNASIYCVQPVNIGGWTHTMQVMAQGADDISTSEWELRHQTTNYDIISGVRSEGGFYAFWYDGTWNPTEVVVTAGDTITVSKLIMSSSNIRIHYDILQGTNHIVENGDVTRELKYTNQDELILEVGDDTGKIGFQNILFIPTGTQTLTNGVYTKKPAHEVLRVARNPNLGAEASNVLINLQAGLARLLGYSSQILNNNGVSHSFVANTSVTTNIFNNDIIVELVQLPLNGYDHGVRRSKNIIMVITSGALNSSTTATGVEQYELSYTDNFPTYISLQNNKQATTYSQLTVRVTSGNQTLVTNGRMSALLLFKDDSDY
jgi:hypothetical protein